MKKTLCFLAAALMALAAFAYDAEVLSVEGKAQASLDGAAWTPLSAGSKIGQGAVIQTAFKSSLKLKFKGTETTLGPMTRIRLDELSESADKDNAVLSMKVGSITSNVKKLEDRRAGFTVRGPAATASVRGTVFREECGYNSDTVTAIESATAVWPTAAQGSASGQAAQTSDGEAAAGAVAIAPGQAASINGFGSQRAPQSHSQSAANDIGAAPGGLAQSEAMGALPGGGMGPAPRGPAGGGGSLGVIKLTLVFENSD